jgi:rhodanese-related sulfurtransferase
MNEVANLNPGEVQDRMATTDPPLLLDVREPEEWDICHLQQAIRISLTELPEQAPGILTEKDRPIIVYCHHGVRSLHAAKWLVANGYEQVSHLAGGIDRWSRELNPSIPMY